MDLIASSVDDQKTAAPCSVAGKAANDHVTPVRVELPSVSPAEVAGARSGVHITGGSDRW